MMSGVDPNTGRRVIVEKIFESVLNALYQIPGVLVRLWISS